MLLNPYNILPIYSKEKDRTCYKPGCDCIPVVVVTTTDKIPNFQLPFPVQGWFLVNNETGEEQQLFINRLDDFCTAEKTYTQFTRTQVVIGVSQASIINPCGYYHLRLVNGSMSYYSEDIHFKTLDTERKQYYKLTFGNSKDINGILYQTGYMQEFIFEGIEDVPEAVNQESALIDGYGREIVTYGRYATRTRIQIEAMPEYVISALSLLPLMSTVKLENLLTGEEINISGQIPRFQVVGDYNVCTKIGELSWEAHNIELHDAGCLENEVLIEC